MERYHMNRKEREIEDRERILDIIKRGRYATLALCMDDVPYLVTLNYGFDPAGNRIFFHAATEGMKLDFMRSNNKCCATVVEDLGYQHGDCSHRYRSAVIFGHLKELHTADSKREGLIRMFEHLEEDPDSMKERFISETGSLDNVVVIRMDIESFTGKESA